MDERGRRTRARSRATAVGILLICVLTACGTAPSPEPRVPVASTSLLGGPSPSAPTTTPSATPSATPSIPEPGRSSARPPTPVGDAPGLADDEHDAYAFARLDEPDRVTVVGHPRTGPAYSTSKLLVVAAYLDTVADGRPDRLDREEVRLVRSSLRESDADAVTTLRDRIPGSSGRAMTDVLRSVGDRATTAPDSYQGLMTWSLREQVRFMAALHDGRVVSRTASAYLLREMRPVASQRWGLGTIGATAYKGGWLRRSTPTRQAGLVDGYAVAIITDTGGPAVRQSDGDAAHVRQIDEVARALERRLAWEEARR